jgi:FtsP/CotA-like multicopper oxidase with cupredoxin domain
MEDVAAEISRRDFLTSKLLGVVIGMSKFQQEHHQHILPEAKPHQHDTVAPEPNIDFIKQALQRRVGALQGFDPLSFLTSFDYGKESHLTTGRSLREFKIVAKDVNLEIAPGLFFPAWTYNGSVPGPTLRCREGDLVRIHFANESISDHTIHFHGIHPANMDGTAEIIKPKESYIYEFTAEPFGLQFYHCHIPPVGLHFNRGLFGAFIVDPKTPRSKAKEMVMIAHGWDINFDNRNEIYALNGPANFYRDNPITIGQGEFVRIYFINALEFEPINSFHLHANFFHVYKTGAQLKEAEYTDLVTLSQAERCIIEFTYNFSGRFMFHAHQNTFAEMGWMGHFDVIRRDAVTQA